MTLQQELRVALAEAVYWEERWHKASQSGPGIDYGWSVVIMCEAHKEAAEAKVMELNRLISEADNEGK